MINEPTVATLKESVKSNNLLYAINPNKIAKLGNPGSLYKDWILGTFTEAIEAQLKGCSVIWAHINKELFELRKKEAASHPNCEDSLGNKTINDEMIISTDIILLDYDTESFDKIPQEVLDQAFLVHPSASITEIENGTVQKTHVLHRLNRIVPVGEIKETRQKYLEQYNNLTDRSCVDPRREFYGKNPRFTDSSYIKVDAEKTVNFDFVPVAKADKVPLENLPDIPSDSITRKFCKYITEDRSIVEIATAILEEFDFEYEERNNQISFKKVDEQTNGTNPFSETNGSAFGSFSLMLTKQDVVLYHDRANKISSNIFGLVQRLELLKDGKDHTKALPKNTRRNFWNYCDLITDALNLDQFQEKEREERKSGRPKEKLPIGRQDDYNNIFDTEEPNTKIKFFNNRDATPFILGYNDFTGTWSYSKNTALYWAIIEADFHRFNTRLAEMELKAVSQGEYWRLLQGEHQRKGLMLHEMPSTSSQYIGFKDRDYDRFSGTFQEFDPEHNVWERLDIESQNYNPKENIRERYLKAFEFMTGSPITAQVLWYYKCAEMMKLGDKAWKLLVLTGASRTGKTSFCGSAKSLSIYTKNDRDIEVAMTKSQLISPHGTERINQSTTCVHLPELAIRNREDIDLILDKVDSSARWVINGKNRPAYSLKRDFVMYASVQDNVQFPAEDTGIKARFVFVKVTLPLEAAEPAGNPNAAVYNDGYWHDEVNELFYDAKMQKDLLLWILHYEKPDLVIQNLNSLINSEELREQKKDATFKNTELSRFFEDSSYEVTGDENDFVPASDLKSQIKAFYTQEEGYRSMTTATAEGKLITFLEINFPDEYVKIKALVTKGQTIDKIIRDPETKKSKRIIPGIRLIESVPSNF